MADTTALAQNTLFLELKLYEWLTLIGIVIGPIAAVLITLFFEKKRRDREAQIQVMRMLLNTRHLPSDPVYSVAINLVPVEFNKQKQVMVAWKDYIDQVRFMPSEDNAEAHDDLVRAKQTTLIFRIMNFLGFNLSETDIQTSAYAASGFVYRDNLYIESLIAWPRLAKALERQNELTEMMFASPPEEKR